MKKKDQNALNSILGSLKQGCTEFKEVTVQVNCFNTFVTLTKNWLGKVNGFDNFVWTQISPMTICLPLSDSFDVNDGQATVFLRDISDFQFHLSKQPPFFDSLHKTLAPFNWPQNVLEGYFNALKSSAKPGQFWEFYQKFIHNYKKGKPK